jgi:hypothetical protein
MTDTTRPATEVARCPVAHGTDFTDPDLIQAGLPMPEFAYLRQNRPLYWNPQTRENSSYDDGGFWLATRWEDVRNDLLGPGGLVERGERRPSSSTRATSDARTSAISSG